MIGKHTDHQCNYSFWYDRIAVGSENNMSVPQLRMQPHLTLAAFYQTLVRLILEFNEWKRFAKIDQVFVFTFPIVTEQFKFFNDLLFCFFNAHLLHFLKTDLFFIYTRTFS